MVDCCLQTDIIKESSSSSSDDTTSNESEGSATTQKSPADQTAEAELETLKKQCDKQTLEI